MSQEKNKDSQSEHTFREYQEDKQECEIRMAELLEPFLQKYNVVLQKIEPLIVYGFGNQPPEVDGITIILN